MSYRIINGKLYPAGNFGNYGGSPSKTSDNKLSNSPSFQDVLSSKLHKTQGFTISNHAAERMRGLNLSEKDMQKLDEGINKAKEKGCKQSVILYRDVAFVASIENRTIITAVQKERAKENVFTNVDSVIFL
jgi:flagellar operon protein